MGIDLVRGRKRKRSDVYRTDMNRLSVYPSFQKPQENTGKRRINIGETIRIRITGIDDDGNPIGLFSSYTVVVIDAQSELFEPGQELSVKVVEVKGKTIYAKQTS